MFQQKLKNKIKNKFIKNKINTKNLKNFITKFI